MDIEKEVRYHVSDESWDKVLNNTIAYSPSSHMLDITLGMYGFDTLSKTGSICRVRHKNDKTTIEVKHRVSDTEWLEESIPVDSIDKGLSFFTLIGLQPYLYISRHREIRTYKNLKIYLDDVEMLGKYIEIEYQDSDEALDEIQSFLDENSILDHPCALYGDIFKEKIEKSLEFREEFQHKLDTLLSK